MHTQHKSHSFIDFTETIYIRIYDTFKSDNSGSRLLKIVDTTNNLGAHTITRHDNMEAMEALFPILINLI